jgi:hypothetical protein
MKLLIFVECLLPREVGTMLPISFKAHGFIPATSSIPSMVSYRPPTTVHEERIKLSTLSE